MGRYRRLILGAALLGAAGTLIGCSKPEAEQRRELLTPPNQAAIQKVKQEKAMVVNGEGELLPSDLVLGGFPVPRGFEIKRSLDNEWYLRSLKVSAARVASYVDKRLFTGSLIRSSVGGFRWDGAQLRDAPHLPKLTVRVSPTKNRDNACELYIRSYANIKVEKLTPEQSEAKLREAAAARFAD
jgi:hypothetical protein